MGILPSKPDPARPVDVRDLVVLLYGPPGIGKSTLASHFAWGGKKPLFLWTSPVKYLAVYKVAIDSWKTFTKVVAKLEQERPDIYSAVVVDVLDMVHNHCRKEVCDARSIEHESDLEFGKGWDMVKSEFARWVAKLTALGYPVVFISHAEAKEQQGRVVKTTKIVPTLAAAAKRVVFPLCDVVGYVGCAPESADVEEGAERRVFFEPTETREAKDWTGRLPKELVLTQGPECAREFLATLTGEAPGGEAPTKKRRRVAARRK